MLHSMNLIPTHNTPSHLKQLQTIQLVPWLQLSQTLIPPLSPLCQGKRLESLTVPSSRPRRTRSTPTTHLFTQFIPLRKEAILPQQTINQSCSKVTLTPMDKIIRPLLQLWLSMDLFRPVCKGMRGCLVYHIPSEV